MVAWKARKTIGLNIGNARYDARFLAGLHAWRTDESPLGVSWRVEQQMYKSSNKFQRAFTLIELLVVIAIIAILAAILFPVFARAKEAAKKTAAIAQMKQLSLAVMMYAEGYDDYFVPA